MLGILVVRPGSSLSPAPRHAGRRHRDAEIEHVRLERRRKVAARIFRAGDRILPVRAGDLLAAALARDQMVRHRRDLFSDHPLRRLAALGYLRSHPNVDNVLLLRDYLSWEQRPMLRKRAAVVLDGMERQLTESRAVEGS